MKIVKFKYIFGVVLAFYPLIFSWGMEDESIILEPNLGTRCMPFKLGLELQEANNLCNWAKPGQTIQKKPLFFMQDASEPPKKLWTLVIDGQDIEFVLEPFAHHEEKLLQAAVESVPLACAPLTQDMFNQNDLVKALQHPKVALLINGGKEINVGAGLRASNLFPNAFEIWKDWLQTHQKYKHTKDDQFKELWENNAEIPIPTSTLFRLAQMAGAKTITFNEWINKIGGGTPLHQRGLNIIINQEYFESVRDMPLKRCQSLKFKPQATIQFPLEYSISLFFSIFDFQPSSAPVVAILDSLPFLDEISKETIGSIMGKHFTKEYGLVFLHALTLSGITSKHTNPGGLLREIVEKDERYRQVDAKMNLQFMSRRPFSDMWKDIRKNKGEFWGLYKFGMKKNKIFSSRFFKEAEEDEQVEWTENISPNYAEEFFLASGEQQNLSYLLSYFLDGFGKEEDKLLDLSGPSNLEILLKKGMISPIMIRHMNPERVKVVSLNDGNKTPQEIVEPYYQQSIATVEVPLSCYIFDPNNTLIYEQEYPYDTLSPPLFLNQNDAMGFFRDYPSEGVQEYGEAIVEIRSIQNAFAEFKDFLTQENRLLEYTWKLFNFLKEIKKNTPFSDKNRNGILTCILQQRSVQK
jgi:hypothetical protein